MEHAAAFLGQLLTGDALSQPIAVLARLGIPELLASGPRTATELATVTATHEDALRRVLRAVVAVGVLAEPAPGTFAETPISALLRPGVPGSMHAVAVLAGAPWRAAAHHLMHTVRTGQSAFEHAYGVPLYAWLSQHPEEGAAFDAVQATHWPSLDVARAADLSQARTLVDVGGGRGELLATLLRELPEARGVLVDLPHVVEGARATLQRAGVEDRCQLAGGDFFERVPEGGDAYLLAFVLHNWDDARASRILARCRAAMREGSRLLVIENVVPEGAPPGFAALLDLEMLIYTAGGRERTEAELRTLFASAGLSLTRTAALRDTVCVLTAC